MRSIFTALIVSILLTSCIPDNIKEKINDGMMVAHKMLADQEFKRAIANIELHRLRNGNYPASLTELQFLSSMDSAMFNYVDYTRLDSGYALDLKMEVPSITDKSTQHVDLSYPAGFWKGLGCVRSNVKQ